MNQNRMPIPKQKNKPLAQPIAADGFAAPDFSAIFQAAKTNAGLVWKPGLAVLLLAVSAAAFSFLAKHTAPGLSSPSAPEITPLAQKGIPAPEISARAVFVVRLSNREILFKRDADERLPVASITKLMTAYLIAERVPPLAFVRFEREAKNIGSADDKRSALAAGESVTGENVLKLLLISSDSDAAYAGAAYVGGLDDPSRPFPERIQKFVAMMNAAAKEIGLGNTHFANPAGTDDPGNYSSARDVAALAGEITRRHPELWLLSRDREAFIFGKNGARYGIVNTDILLEEFPAIYGSKTGLDDIAEGALALVYHLSGREPLAIILLKSPERFEDGRRLINWIEANFVIQ